MQTLDSLWKTRLWRKMCLHLPKFHRWKLSKLFPRSERDWWHCCICKAEMWSEMRRNSYTWHYNDVEKYLCKKRFCQIWKWWKLLSWLKFGISVKISIICYFHEVCIKKKEHCPVDSLFLIFFTSAVMN